MSNFPHNVTYQGSTVFIDEKAMVFGIPIEDVAIAKHAILVLLNYGEINGTKYENRNVICIDGHGKCKWIVEERGGIHKDDPLVGLTRWDDDKEYEEKVFCLAWSGMKYEIDIDTGSLKELRAYRFC